MILLLLLLPPALGAQFHVHWNATRTRSEGPGRLEVELLDRILFHCPHYNETFTEDQTEMTILYMVPREDYEGCRLGGGARAIGQCLSPFLPLSLSLVVRSFSPLPNAPEFRPGSTYYIVSTSTGSEAGLKNREGGLCADSDLKLTLHVQPLPTTTHPPLRETTTITRVFHPRMLNNKLDEAAARPDPTPNLQPFLEKLNQPPSIGHGAWWNPQSAPDYVPLPPATKRTMGDKDNTLYRVTETREVGEKRALWSATQSDAPALSDQPVLFEIQEGSWTAGYGMENGVGRLPVSGLLFTSLLVLVWR